ncbi:CapA family protein [Methanoculleus sp.]|uniref:CapA family protein n=1 Tax=Methanoculleus sp. TaxID=90427 RepID=UPI0026332A6D|nr:CapA family protein [Methanoculleus sp.]MDI6867741.1 CapA family protein [Methanoculleus sp.]
MALNEQISSYASPSPYLHSLMRQECSTPSTTMLICGDLFINTSEIGGSWERVINKFDDTLVSLIKSADFALVNLEAPTTLSPTKILKSGPSLRMEPSVLPIIKRIGFNGFTLANNHVMDFGEEGLIDTISGARDLGLFTCGAGLNIHDAIQPIVIQRPDGLRIAVFSFCEMEFGVSDESIPGSAWISHPSVLLEVKKYTKTVDCIIVVAHGGLEYTPLPPPERQVQLRQFIDAGADVVVGHHPHVPQGCEKYNGGYIFYSTGNFIFDSRDGLRRPETEWGYMVQLQFDSKGIIGVGLFLTDNEEDTVRLIKDPSQLMAKNAYLSELSGITQDQDRYKEYWQELAIRLYYSRYAYVLVFCFLPHLFITAYNLFRRCIGKDFWYPCKIKCLKRIYVKNLAFLNIIRNESHSWTLKRALSIITLQETDVRRTGTKKEVDRLLLQGKEGGNIGRD